MRIVVCDAEPILHLREANTLNLLARAGEVLVPPAVDRELQSLMADWSASRPSWVRIVRLSERPTSGACQRCDGREGEGEGRCYL